MKRIALLLGFCCFALGMTGQEVAGEWDGALSFQGKSLRIVFHITPSGTDYKATMDSPDQGAKGLKMSHTTVNGNQVTLELRIAGIRFDGTVQGDSLIGTFQQGGASIPLNLVRVKTAATAEQPNAVIPTDCVETPVEVEIKTGKLSGTLMVPKSFKKGPLALIIAGSGPTDRDGNNPSMTSNAYRLLAADLAAKGIASLRYDKRGIGESAAAAERESDLRFDDYVNDAKSWLQWIRTDKRFNRLVVIGHSEGSLIGMLASGDADRFVSLAGPGKPANEILKEQLKAMPQEVQDQVYLRIDSLASGKTVHATGSGMESLFRPSVQPYLISWFKYNPSVVLASLKKPVLIIQGTTDIQVLVEDARLLSKSRPDAGLLLFEGMNHVLKEAPADREANLAIYNQPELPLAKGLVDGIAKFILASKP